MRRRLQPNLASTRHHTEATLQLLHPLHGVDVLQHLQLSLHKLLPVPLPLPLRLHLPLVPCSASFPR